jgi:hypothetical protein
MAIVLTPGRSGSSLISHVLSLHPSVLSLSEMLSFLEYGDLPPVVTSRDDVVRVLLQPRAQMLDQIRLSALSGEMRPERWACARPGPLVAAGVADLVATDDLELWLDEVVVPLVPCRTSTVVEAICGHLCAASGKHCWVERSGGTLLWADRIVDDFAEERSVVLLRDPLLTVQSMARHVCYQFAAVRWQLRRVLRFDPYSLGNEVPAARLEADDVPPHIWSRMPGRITVADLDASGVRLERYAYMWSAMVTRAFAAKPSDRDAPRVFTIEDLVSDERHLSAVARALGLPPDAAWEQTSGPDALRAWTGSELLCLSTRTRQMVRRALTPGLHAVRAMFGRVPDVWLSSLRSVDLAT